MKFGTNTKRYTEQLLGEVKKDQKPWYFWDKLFTKVFRKNIVKHGLLSDINVPIGRTLFFSKGTKCSNPSGVSYLETCREISELELDLVPFYILTNKALGLE